MAMLKLAIMRGARFWVAARKAITWSDGSVMVPAGAAGAAVIAYGGELPGWIVEWDGYGICAIVSAEEGDVWQRVMRPAKQLQ